MPLYKSILLPAMSAVLLLFNQTLLADHHSLSVEETQEKLEREEIILVDIRTPQEWTKTGVAEHAQTFNLYADNFLENISALSQQNPGKPIALICASGRRSANTIRKMTKALPNIQFKDVSEGMLGNTRHNGWLKKGLPIKKYIP